MPLVPVVDDISAWLLEPICLRSTSVLSPVIVLAVPLVPTLAHRVLEVKRVIRAMKVCIMTK